MKSLILFLLLLAPVPALATPCNITASGPIQADGKLGGGNPLEADVYQIQGTITANYVDDDEANNGTVTFTSPNGGHTITVGMFLLNQHAKGANTFAVRVAAGYVASGVWMPGPWTWSMSYSDRAGNRCTASGSFTVQNSFAPSNGFLRNYHNTPNLITDGNNLLFFPMGNNGIGFYLTGGVPTCCQSEVPQQAMVRVANGSPTATFVSGVQFNTNSQPSNITPNLTICPTAACTILFNVTISSSTSITLPSNWTGTSGTYSSDLDFTRNLGVSFSHATGYQSTLANAAAWTHNAWGQTLTRFSAGNGVSLEMEGSYLGTGYNDYNWSNSGRSPWGVTVMDQWFAANRAAGIHAVFGEPAAHGGPCPSYSCTSTELQNMQNFFAYASARWGAFIDVWELQNEGNPNQTWVDDIGAALTSGVSGIAGGNPIDPYGHFFTVSWMPSNSTQYSPVYGPYSGRASDAYLNWIELDHINNLSGQTVYGVFTGSSFAGCPASGGRGGTTLPRWNGEMATEVGIAPSSQTASAPNLEQDGPRVTNEQLILNRCGGTIFGGNGGAGDYFEINSTKPIVSANWYTTSTVIFENFLSGLDPAAVPLTVTLGGGCGSGACSYAALGSSSHIRLVVLSAEGKANTGVPYTVKNGRLTFTAPAAGMTGKWFNTSTGEPIGSSFTTRSGSNTVNIPPMAVDMWLAVDSPPSQ